MMYRRKWRWVSVCSAIRTWVCVARECFDVRRGGGEKKKKEEEKERRGIRRAIFYIKECIRDILVILNLSLTWHI